MGAKEQICDGLLISNVELFLSSFRPYWAAA
jgi:hypothetical protein